ncbi:MAG: hypothetical protein JO223_01540 [Hyphomicrobiales bacterium]|nr:hypothetical protein [Hyphomicrobiales bacterium]MBV8442527.1 hypothetical protein [Hyphomicrobiales bacterium]
MAASNATLRRLLARLALAALTTLAAAAAANAQWFPPPSAASPYEYVQWFPPIGAASPQEIAERLRAEGFVLVGPLHRNDTVYLADVNAGPGGRERLVIDAWSGEILQRIVARSPYSRPGGGYVIERGEFDSPPPLAPPPARDFFVSPGGNGNLAYGGPANARIPEAVGPVSPLERTPRARVKPKPAASRHAPAESKPTAAAVPPAQPLKTDEGGANPAAKDNSGGGATPAGAAPPATPPPASEASKQPNAPPKPEAPPTGSTPAAPPDQTKGAAPNPEGAASSPNMPQTQAKGEPRPPQSEPPAAVPSAPAAKPSDKSKVNDVPVNPLE